MLVNFGLFQIFVVVVIFAIFIQRKYGILSPPKDPHAKQKEPMIVEKPGRRYRNKYKLYR